MPIQSLLQNDPKTFIDYLCGADPEIAAQTKDMRWDTSQYPIVRSEDQQITINLRKGLILRSGYRRTYLPKQIWDYVAGIRELYEEGKMVDALGINTFQWKYPAGHLIHLVVNLDSMQIEKLTRTIPEGKTLIRSSSLPAPFNHPNKSQFWMEEKTGNCYVTKAVADRYEPLYLYHCKPGTKEVDSIESFRSLPRKERTFVQSVKPGSFEWLTKIDEETNIVLLANEQGEPRHIDFTNLNLQFDASQNSKGEVVWMCRQRPGFYLTSPQHVSVFEKIGIDSYLLLQNKNGDQEVLLPAYENGRKVKHPYGYYRYDYKFNESKDKRILSGNAEANLYLSLAALSS